MPLAPAPVAVSAGRVSGTLAAAELAHNFGQFSAAEENYRRLLGATGVDEKSVRLALVAVLLDAGRAVEAKAELNLIPEPRGAAWHLRSGLAALQLRDRATAQAAWDATTPAELGEVERAWHIFLEGALYDLLPVSNTQKANELYRAAEEAAKTELGRARFQLSAERVRLHLTPPSEQRVEEIKRAAEANRGLDIGYEQARVYALMLVQRDRKADALAFLRDQVLRTPNREWRDEFSFLLGLIGERSRNAEGRNALFQLLANGVKPERLRQALELLAAASVSGPERSEFRVALDRLIAATPPHPIKETLLYFRGVLALADREYVTAENDANQLLRDFPTSRLRVHAFGLLTQSAWDQQRYRSAANNAAKAREALLSESTPGSAAARVRADLGVFEAEASFRAGLLAERIDRGVGAGKVDYRAAADAYAALLRERPPELDAKKLGALMLQCVLAEIKAGSAIDAAKRLDEFEDDAAFDLENRWQAEWSLADAARTEGNTVASYARVTRLRGENTTGIGALPPVLRAKMAWLEAQLSFDAGQFEQTLAHADRLLGSLDGLEGDERSEIASMAILLKAKAELALARESAALETLARLRAQYPKTKSAGESYLILAMYYAGQEKIDLAQRTLMAQRTLTALVDNPEYATSPYIPIALFRLAGLSDQLGTEESLTAANLRIEELVKLPAAEADVGLIFLARMKQGDILRRLNRYPLAQRAYEDLVNKYPQRPEVVFAQLELAKCYNAQSSVDPRNTEIAKAKFEELLYRQGAPIEVKVEAGYILGELLARAGKRQEALSIWWRDIATPLLIEKDAKIAAEESPTLGYWLGRTLVHYADLQQTLGRVPEAKDAYRLIIQKKLGYFEKEAREKLQSL